MTQLLPCPFCGVDDADYMPDRLMAPGADPPVFCNGCHASAMDAAAWNRRAPTWQPIETVPRDGTFFVICRAGEDDFYEVGRYEPQYWSTYVPVDGGLYRKDRQTINEWTHSNFHRATHWQPLPPPPTEKPK